MARALPLPPESVVPHAHQPLKKTILHPPLKSNGEGVGNQMTSRGQSNSVLKYVKDICRLRPKSLIICFSVVAGGSLWLANLSDPLSRQTGIRDRSQTAHGSSPGISDHQPRCLDLMRLVLGAPNHLRTYLAQEGAFKR